MRYRIVRWFATVLISILTACMPPVATTDSARYMVFFDEFSAAITDDAHRIINDVAKRAREAGVSRLRIEGRASATGSIEANRRLAATRTQVVAEELHKAGIAPALPVQSPIGQTGSGDTSVVERRVDIVFER